MHLCATGSEDTKINIVLWRRDKSGLWTLENLHSITAHISSVRTLACNESGVTANAKVLFSAGGRAQMNVWRVKYTYLPKDSPHTQQVGAERAKSRSVGAKDSVKVQYELIGSHMLTYKGLRRNRRSKQGAVEPDPETRYMSITSFFYSTNAHVHGVAAACSDGILR